MSQFFPTAVGESKIKINPNENKCTFIIVSFSPAAFQWDMCSPEGLVEISNSTPLFEQEIIELVNKVEQDAFKTSFF